MHGTAMLHVRVSFLHIIMRFSLFVHAEIPLSDSSKAPYVHKGCYGDESNRALSVFIGSLNKDGRELVNECYRMTRDKGYGAFGVQDGKECWSDPNAECFYDKHGNRSNCRHGTGGMWANDVYFIELPSCSDQVLCPMTLQTGFMIEGQSVLGRHVTYSELHCADKCLRDTHCRAYNYQLSAAQDGTHKCETVAYQNCHIKNISKKKGFGFRIFPRKHFEEVSFGLQTISAADTLRCSTKPCTS